MCNAVVTRRLRCRRCNRFRRSWRYRSITIAKQVGTSGRGAGPSRKKPFAARSGRKDARVVTGRLHSMGPSTAPKALRIGRQAGPRRRRCGAAATSTLDARRRRQSCQRLQHPCSNVTLVLITGGPCGLQPSRLGAAWRGAKDVQNRRRRLYHRRRLHHRRRRRSRIRTCFPSRLIAPWPSAFGRRRGPSRSRYIVAATRTEAVPSPSPCIARRRRPLRPTIARPPSAPGRTLGLTRRRAGVARRLAQDAQRRRSPMI
mmetsp:Transcript_121424/g.388303  ORF Transcript_121424/g.388303 Transcript_121424/m.388303 type:complete len:258 (+) Transcript_121424:636-1409(+)